MATVKQPAREPFSFSLVDKLKGAPFGAMLGAVGAGAILWLAPGLKPEDWTDESFLALSMGAGLAVHRLAAGLGSWFVVPLMRHLGSRWEAAIALRKLRRYRELGLLAESDARRMATVIARADINAGKRERKRLVVPRASAPKPDE